METMKSRHVLKDVSKLVYLEPISESRRAEFINLANASREFHRKWSAPPSTHSKYSKYLERIENDSYRCFFICRRTDKKLVGVINVSQIYWGNLCSAYLGYYVFKPFAKNGYMSAGLVLVLRKAFQTLKLHRLEANIQPGNVASKRLAKRLGFRKEGFSKRYLKVQGKWCDHERWAITIEEWVRRKNRGLQ